MASILFSALLCACVNQPSVPPAVASQPATRAFPGASGKVTFGGGTVFDAGSSKLRVDQRGSLTRAVEMSKKTWGGNAICGFATGHAEVGEVAAADLAGLSLARAAAVADWVRANGGAGFRIEVTGHGAKQPAFEPPNQGNARVEIEFLACDAR